MSLSMMLILTAFLEELQHDLDQLNATLDEILDEVTR